MCQYTYCVFNIKDVICTAESTTSDFSLHLIRSESASCNMLFDDTG